MAAEMAAEMIYISLPSDIKTEIFSQLPLHSIIQCKCVCKSWHSLIDELLNCNTNDPSFFDMHTRRLLSSSPSPPVVASCYTSFLARKKFSNCRNQFDITGDDNDNDWKMDSKFSKHCNQVHIIGDDTDNDWNIVSSCNGLICLVKNHNGWPSFNVCICNPFIREYVNLPPQFDLQRPPPWQKNGLIIANGFGCVPNTNEYKFVRINYDLRKVYVSVYVLGSGTWSIKEFDAFEDYSCPLLWCFESKAASAGLLFNGALYWSIPPYDNIISFDLKTEEFRTVPSPPSPRLCKNVDEIWVLGECFCVVRKKGTEKEIWVMNKEEEDYTWTMKFAIKPAFVSNVPFVREEKILLSYDYMKFACYDPKTTSHDHYLNTNTMNSQMVDWFEILLPYMSRFEMIPYMRSLVSLRALGESADVVARMKRKRKRESVDTCVDFAADWLESIFPVSQKT